MAPRAVRIPVVCVQPGGEEVGVAYPYESYAPRHARTLSGISCSSGCSSRQLDFRTLTLLDGAACSPLWSAAALAASEVGSPCARHAASFGTAADLTQLQATAQAHVAAQAQAQQAALPPIGFALAPLPDDDDEAALALPPAASASAPGAAGMRKSLHLSRRSADTLGWAAWRLEKEQQLADPQPQPASPADAHPWRPWHRRSRSTGLVHC